MECLQYFLVLIKVGDSCCLDPQYCRLLEAEAQVEWYFLYCWFYLRGFSSYHWNYLSNYHLGYEKDRPKQELQSLQVRINKTQSWSRLRSQRGYYSLRNLLKNTKMTRRAIVPAIKVMPHIVLSKFFAWSPSKAIIPLTIKHRKTRIPLPCIPLILKPKKEIQGKNIEMIPIAAAIKTNFLCLFIVWKFIRVNFSEPWIN